MEKKNNPTTRLLAFVERFKNFDRNEVLTPVLAEFARNGFDASANGNLPRWMAALDELPEPPERIRIDLNSSAPSVRGDGEAPSPAFLEALESALKKLHPWRKGPFNLFGVQIDAEWRSNLKWDRLRGAISPLSGRLVLDVGCGNGYYGLRMAGEGAEMVVGVDNGLGAVLQFHALDKYFQAANLAVFPGSVDDLPDSIELFDTVFSMGMLYHRKEPLDHLKRLFSFLKPGGECVLETIVVDGDDRACLRPPGRYAQMRNVHNIPSAGLAARWLRSAGFGSVRVADVSTTTADEQRSTSWMTYNSLADFLDLEDPSKTVEGHPAPKRALLIAEKPAIRIEKQA